MKIKNALIKFHFRSADIKTTGNNESRDELIIIDSQDNIVFKNSSYNDGVMPNFENFIGNTLILSTKDGIIKGVIKEVKTLFGQYVYLFGEIISESDYFLNWSCVYGIWRIEPKDLPYLKIELQSNPIDVSLDDYKYITEKSNELYFDVYGKLFDISFEKNELNFSENNFPKIEPEMLEVLLKDFIARAYYIKMKNPKLFELIISVLENKNINSEMGKENQEIK